MAKTSTELTPNSTALAVALPNDALDVAALKQDDDGTIEARHAALDEAFDWSIGRFSQTYRDLA